MKRVLPIVFLAALAGILGVGCGTRLALDEPVLPIDAGSADDSSSPMSGRPDTGTDVVDAREDTTTDIGISPSCPVTEYIDPGLYFAGSYPSGRPYGGRAHVTDSTPNDLVFLLTDPPATGVGGPYYVTVSGTPAPMLPIGADVWLTLTYEGATQTSGLGWAYSVSDRRDGTILFGQTNEDPGEHLGLINPSRAVPYCARKDCYVQTFYEVEVPGAEPSFIQTGSSAAIEAVGVSYQFWVEATAVSIPPSCGVPQPPAKLVLLTYEATDLAARVAGLTPD